MIVGIVVSIWLFSNQQNYVGVLSEHHPAFGDLTFEAGFVISAVLYYAAGQARPDRRRRPGRCDRQVSVRRTGWPSRSRRRKLGLAEGGIPIGGALIGRDGEVLGRGHNRRVQDGDPSMHGETSAFRNAGRQASYRGTTMVTTLSPCWYCSGLIRQFGISRVVIGEARTFYGGHDWLAENGVEVVLLDDAGLRADDDRLHRRPPGPVERGHRSRLRSRMCRTYPSSTSHPGWPAPTARPSPRRSTRRSRTSGSSWSPGTASRPPRVPPCAPAAREFFALPAAVKQRYAVTVAGRGWLPPGRRGERLRRGDGDAAGPQGVLRGRCGRLRPASAGRLLVPGQRLARPRCRRCGRDRPTTSPG